MRVFWIDVHLEYFSVKKDSKKLAFQMEIKYSSNISKHLQTDLDNRDQES